MSFRILNLLTDRISMIISHSKDYPKTIFNHYLNTFLYVLFQVLLIPIFLNTFESDKFAFLFFLIGMINFSSIGIGWLSSGLLKSFGENYSNKNYKNVYSIYKISILLTIVYSIFFIFCFIISILFIDKFNINKNDFYLSIFFVSLAIILKLLTNPDIQFLNSLEKQSTPLKIDNIRLILIISGVIILKDYFSNVYEVLFLLTTSILINFFYLKVKTRKFNIFKFKLKINIIKDFRTLLGTRSIKYGIVGFFIIILQSDLIILGYLSSPDVIKKYIIVWKIPELIFLLLLKIPASLEPTIIKLAAKKKYKDIEEIHKSFYYYFFVVIFISIVVYYYISDFLIYLWLGTNFSLNSTETILCCINVFFITSVRWNLAFLHALAKLDFLIKILLLEIILKISLIIIFIEKFSYMTPIYASTTCHILLFFWIYSNARKKIFL